LVSVLHFVKNNLLLLSSGVRHVVTLSKNFKYTIFLNNKFGRSRGGIGGGGGRGGKGLH
jgi:hypothetical protein